MTLERAKEILKPYIGLDKGLENSTSPYIDWNFGDSTITLDGEFELELLEALVIYLSQKL